VRAAALLVAILCAATAAAAATVPAPVLDALHGRVAGWARSGPDWFAVYTDRAGGGWCGLEGASWRMALVANATGKVVADRRVAGAMCGNSVGFVEAGRFSDGRHEEVAFQLWATPSTVATTWIYRVESGRFLPLASFPGDTVTIGPGTVTVRFENRGRSRHGEIEDLYRFTNGRYRLAERR